MYWSVGSGGGDGSSPMEPQDGPVDMGGRQSTASDLSISESPVTETIQGAYKSGDFTKAQELIKRTCQENLFQVEKCHLLSISAAYGDLQVVRYLLKEVCVTLPTEPNDDNPAVLAAYFGHSDVVTELLDSLPAPTNSLQLLNWMLAVACQRGHSEVVRLLVCTYRVDPDSCAVRKNEFPALIRLPLYAAIRAGHEDIAAFLLQNGAFLGSYTLMDCPVESKRILHKYFIEPTTSTRTSPAKPGLCVNWSNLHLPWVDLDWLIDISLQITELDLSANCLTSVPSVIPWGLINIQKLNLSDNRLNEISDVQSSDSILCSRLLEIDVSANRFQNLPSGFLHLSRLQSLIATKNYLERLFNEDNATNWLGLRKLNELDVSDNRLVELPAPFLHSLKSLNILNVSKNNLKEFPQPWVCPLKCCKADKNALQCLPDTLGAFWKNHLKEVDFSENALKEVPQCLFQLEALVSLKLSGNQLSILPSPEKWSCRLLKTLDLSKNQLGKADEGAKTKRISFFSTKCRTRSGTETGPTLEFPEFLCESLEVLYLNDNQLDTVPQSVCFLKGLSELYLGNNRGIQELPPELGQLSNLWQLDLEELTIANLPAEIRKEGPKTILAFLRAQLRKAEPCNSMKMIVVGPPRQGKSTLIEILQTGRTSQAMPSDVTIRTTKWELPKPPGFKSKIDSVVFNVWDIGGPASMSTVNQCFFTDKALYVVVWNLALGEEAIANLQFWLLNIEAKAPNSVVLVVGTHLDLIDTKFRVERIATLRAYVLAICRSPAGSRATGFPDITLKNLHELSCKTLEGLDGLRQLIYHITCNMKDAGSSICSQKLVGRLIPRSYLRFRESIIAEQQRRSQKFSVQYLMDKEIETLVERTPGNDIRDYEDLQSAINFLIETGTLLHFPDTSHGLRNLYFLDPVWLSECLQQIFSIKSSKSVAKNGVIKAEDLRMLLIGTGFIKQTEEQYFQFLAKFEIALPVANNSYLLPHLLPAKPALDIHSIRHQMANAIQRVFKMSFVPVGFWQRFIARMLISLAEMDLQFFENKKATKNRRKSTVIYSFTGRQRNRCSTFRVKRNHTIYWQEGLFVTFDGGYLSVESSDVNWKKKKSGGIKIICQSDTRDFSAMAFITDHINSLIDQWFPALTATESDGTLLMEQYVPCPVCSTPKTQDGKSQQIEDMQFFNMEDCVLTAIELDTITCPNHPDIPVPLQELVPELFMTDFPSRLFLENSKLAYSENENNILGQGGSGTVIYQAQYQGKLVAVKQFLVKKCINSAFSATDTMLRHLWAADAMKNFSEFRQEASMLHSLQHPCVVSLIGISIHPLCFALELAPLGSLTTVLSENSKGASFVPLGHMLTLKIAYQIAAGLAYLHKKNIIFCDLKSDNILVWSLDVKESVNIKLSDYGISRQSFHEGALGVEGTPGYQAPEIRPRIVYDEKVDMFSYGMVIYELLSGQRPVLGQHQLQIAKKLSKGIRPALGQPEEVQFHRMQVLMMECWDTKPEQRPLATSVVGRMKDPTFATFMYLLPCGKQSSFFSSHGQEYTVIFWDGKEETRNYTVVNAEKGLIEVARMSCPGTKLCCQLKVQSCLWTATEDQKIYVYSLQGMCPLKAPQKGLDTPAAVTCLFAVPDAKKNPYPVKAMETANSGTEVWYSNGPGILVLDCTALAIVRRLEPYSPPSTVVSIVCSSDCDGEEMAWCLDDETNFLVMYYTATYQLCARYFCGDRSPLRDMFTIQQPSALISTMTLARNRTATPELGSLVDVSIVHSPELGTQILNHQDSLTDYCSLSSHSPSVNNRVMRSPSSWPSSPVSSSSVPFSVDSEELDKLKETSLCRKLENDSGPADDDTGHLQATTILPVKDLVWIPRRGGDVVVIGLEKEGDSQRGRVMAVLKAAELTPHGSLVDAAILAKDTVACCFRNDNMDFCVAVWKGWGAKDFDLFYKSYEELGRLETCMRKRR
ncbi:leucine-rich repeat serine/threonine-protein kinase 1 isoform X2 [Sphaerodactylus townsendi]|uniref:leucine-rich repeat serine/threonine-protein kinase 1 isoform X2 n=1 Tax=Sphaerodactylus townsendi TaxID=933632 RepID=UPI002027364D|nr:leucine-rich repeat serine/threonine-protein kinase 1 isoform X2 [Sphaerodactylus townsendi]